MLTTEQQKITRMIAVLFDAWEAQDNNIDLFSYKYTENYISYLELSDENKEGLKNALYNILNILKKVNSE